MRKLTSFLHVIILAFLTGLAPSCGQAIHAAVPDTAGFQFLNWYNASPDSLGIQGAQVEKAYRELLQNKKNHTVIVAVIDGGVDISHEDLEGHIWTNAGEIENNGRDDDQNGFIDDIHGWNFLGNAKGENITYETFEVTRIVKKFDPQYHAGNASQTNQTGSSENSLYPAAKKEFDRLLKKYQDEKENIDIIYKGYFIATGNVKTYLNKDSVTHEDLESINTPDEMVMRSRNYLLYLESVGYTGKDLEAIKENNYNHLYYHLNLEYNPRRVIGDDPETAGTETYGNNDVTGEKAEHGTFVSGIIAGVRNNGIGINGIASDVKIMSLRVVPDGDERDKDVANAIRYAVDNGAQVINCSFGKSLSPQKGMVDDAIRLASKKGVIIVHASGNESTDNDKTKHYPTHTLVNGEVLSDNWITVGASGMKADKTLAAKFSNYGIKDVDLFAPGVDIYSLHPGNTYNTGDGTSFACPVVTGIVALLKSYFPELTPAEIKNAVIGSVSRFPGLKVYLPVDKEKQKKKIKFEKLSVSGGLVNAYEAVKLADLKLQQRQH